MVILVRAVGIGEFSHGIAAVTLSPEDAEKLIEYARLAGEICRDYPGVLALHCSSGIAPCAFVDEETAQDDSSLEFYERLSGNEDYIFLEELPESWETVDRAYAVHVTPDSLYWTGESWETEMLPLEMIAAAARRKP